MLRSGQAAIVVLRVDASVLSVVSGELGGYQYILPKLHTQWRTSVKRVGQEIAV